MTDQPTAPPPDLASLYAAALATGQAGDLVRALCLVHGLSVRGLAEVSGLGYSTLRRWTYGDKAQARAVRDLGPLIRPTKLMLARIAVVRATRPLGRTGRPRKSV